MINQCDFPGCPNKAFCQILAGCEHYCTDIGTNCILRCDEHQKFAEWINTIIISFPVKIEGVFK